VVECIGLENRRGRKFTGGSNPSSSANAIRPPLAAFTTEGRTGCLHTGAALSCKKALGPESISAPHLRDQRS
jgi:hypothetical protein